MKSLNLTTLLLSFRASGVAFESIGVEDDVDMLVEVVVVLTVLDVAREDAAEVEITDEAVVFVVVHWAELEDT